MTTSRSILVSSLQDKEDSADKSLEKLNLYLENLRRLIKSVDKSTSAVGEEVFKFDLEPIYEWRGHLTGESLFFGSNSLMYELIMVLHCKAILHHQKAKSLIALDVVSQVSEAGKQLLAAASLMNGICGYLSTGILNTKLNNKMQNPPEVYHGVCLSLYHYFRGSAEVTSSSSLLTLFQSTYLSHGCMQALSTIKALTTSSTPLQLKSRLAFGVMSSAVSALTHISTNPAATGANFLYLVHLAAVRELFIAIAFLHLAEANMEKKEVGLAMAYCSAAKVCGMLIQCCTVVMVDSVFVEQSHLAVQKKAVFCVTEQGMPNCSHLPGATTFLNECLDGIYSTAERENRFVYFLQVGVKEHPIVVHTPPKQIFFPLQDVTWKIIAILNLFDCVDQLSGSHHPAAACSPSGAVRHEPSPVH